MSKSTRLRFSDIRAIYRLFNEIIDLADSPLLWREHMTVELVKLFQLQMAVTYVMPLSIEATDVGFRNISISGLDVGVTQTWLTYGQCGDVSPDPCTPAILSRMGSLFSAGRRELLDDRTWYRSDYFNGFRRSMNSDDLLVSLLPLPQLGVVHGLSGDRPVGERPIGRRETVCANLLQQELQKRWGMHRATLPRLTPRLEELLGHLRGPATEKQVADAMGLSNHTIHNHIRRLYARFGVSSRRELTTHLHHAERLRVPHLGNY